MRKISYVARLKTPQAVWATWCAARRRNRKRRRYGGAGLGAVFGIVMIVLVVLWLVGRQIAAPAGSPLLAALG